MSRGKHMRKSLCPWTMQRFLRYNKIIIHERKKTISDFIKIKNSFLKDIVKRIKRQAADVEKIFTKHKSNTSKYKEHTIL